MLQCVRARIGDRGWLIRHDGQVIGATRFHVVKGLFGIYSQDFASFPST